MEAAMKLARQYFLELSPSQPGRTRFIARKQSYHGTTLGSLAMGGHLARRKLFEPMLMGNISHVSMCNVYRGPEEGETLKQYVLRLQQELDNEFQRVGPGTVCAFVAEPVVGAVSLFQDTLYPVLCADHVYRLSDACRLCLDISKP
jgi:adenosylmethionine-8-amino-7-oxononanoate aminotransferase